MGYWDSIGKSDEWYTPKYIFEALNCRFDQDVASPENCPTFVPADEFITRDSLQKDWNGFVWMNPPFGGRNGITPWLEKFFGHGNGIALTPDRTSAPWFQEAWEAADAVLFTRKIKFLRPDGTTGNSPSNGTSLMAAGPSGRAALHRAAHSGLGILATPAKMHRREDAGRGSRQGQTSIGSVAISKVKPLHSPEFRDRSASHAPDTPEHGKLTGA